MLGFMRFFLYTEVVFLADSLKSSSEDEGGRSNSSTTSSGNSKTWAMVKVKDAGHFPIMVYTLSLFTDARIICRCGIRIGWS